MATSWTDSSLSTSIKVKATHVTELKTAVSALITAHNAAYKLVKNTPGNHSDIGQKLTAITLGTVSASTSTKISKANISNLQKAVNSLQADFSNNCYTCQKNCRCQAQCCDYDCDCSDNDGDGDYE